MQSDDIEKQGFDECALWYLGAGQRKYFDIERAVAHLHGMLEVLMKTTAPSSDSRRATCP